MIGEISRNETNEIKSPVEHFRNIKPEKEMTTQEADAFWKSEFHQEEQAKPETTAKEYVDDNGKKYREGNELLPDTQFEVRGYQYETDHQGRIISAEGTLRLKEPDYQRSMENVSKIDGQEYRPTDHQGHLIGHRFDGSDKLENLVPMDANLNKGDFAKLENMLANAVQDGADVKLKVQPVYETNSTRPSEFRVNYSIDGDKDAVVFKNERETKP